MNKLALSTLVVLVLLGCLSFPAEGQVGRGKFGVGLSASGNMLQSDWKSNDPGYGASVDISYAIGNDWGLLAALGFDSFSGKDPADLNVLATAFHGRLAGSYDFLPNKILNPFLFAGAGLSYYFPRVDNGRALLSGKDRPWDVFVNGGIGVDYFLDESWSIIVTANATMMGSDNFDGYAAGSNDIIGRVSVGVRYYLFDRSTVQRIVDAVQK